MSNWKVVEVNGDREWPKESRAEAEEAIEEFGPNMDSELKIVGPDESEEPKPGSAEDMDSRTPSDVEVIDMGDTTEETNKPDTGQSGADLPERDLQEDPIVWLQRGSDEFVVDIKGTPVVTKKGWRVLQYKYDISTTSEVMVGPEETDYTYCRVKATATMPGGKQAEAHGSAHVDRDDDDFLLVEMADTRAKSRALSDVTGTGAVAREEMDGVET